MNSVPLLLLMVLMFSQTVFEPLSQIFSSFVFLAFYHEEETPKLPLSDRQLSLGNIMNCTELDFDMVPISHNESYRKFRRFYYHFNETLSDNV